MSISKALFARLKVLTVFAVFCCSATVFFLFVQESFAEDPMLLLEKGRSYFYRAVEDEDYIDKAEKIFQTLVASNGRHKASAEMYLATLQSLRGKHAFWPLKKLNITNEAIEGMDKVVAKYPKDFETRFLRASTYFYLPFFFGKGEEAKKDVGFLAEQYRADLQQSYPKDLVINVGKFLLETGYLSDLQRTGVKEQLQELNS